MELTNAHAPRPRTARPLLKEYGDECDMLGGPLFKALGASVVRSSLSVLSLSSLLR